MSLALSAAKEYKPAAWEIPGIPNLLTPLVISSAQPKAVLQNPAIFFICFYYLYFFFFLYFFKE